MTHLDVDDEDVVLGGRDDGGDGAEEAAVERRQEGGGRRVVQAHRDRVVQHGVRHEPHEDARHGANLVYPVWKEKTSAATEFQFAGHQKVSKCNH